MDEEDIRELPVKSEEEGKQECNITEEGDEAGKKRSQYSGKERLR